MNRLVRLIVRMEIGQKIRRAAQLDEVSSARGLHGFHGLRIGRRRAKRQGAVRDG